MLRLINWLPFVLVVVIGKCLVISSGGQDISAKIAKALAKWHRLEAEKIALLPLRPVTCPIGKVGSPLLCVGPVMAVVRRDRVYVVDDKENKLIECSIDGKLLRQLKFPPNAPKSFSGTLSLCGDWLWISFEEAPYAFAVDLNRWQVVEERVWEGGKRSNRSFDISEVVIDLFAMPDKTLYAVMPSKWEFQAVEQWKLVKINPNGEHQEQIVKDWYPCYVTSDGRVFWVSHSINKVHKILKLGWAKFGDPINIIAEINAADLGVSSIYGHQGTIIGIYGKKIICKIDVDISISEQSEFVCATLLIAISKNGQVKPIGLLPSIPMSVRYWCRPRYSMYNGQVYFIAREDMGENSHFWLMKLKIQF